MAYIASFFFGLIEGTMLLGMSRRDVEQLSEEQPKGEPESEVEEPEDYDDGYDRYVNRDRCVVKVKRNPTGAKRSVGDVANPYGVLAARAKRQKTNVPNQDLLHPNRVFPVDPAKCIAELWKAVAREYAPVCPLVYPSPCRTPLAKHFSSPLACSRSDPFFSNEVKIFISARVEETSPRPRRCDWPHAMWPYVELLLRLATRGDYPTQHLILLPRTKRRTK
jgi:hypothetical protein